MPIFGTEMEVKSMWDSLTYHCMQMLKFMKDHMNDPYFKTDNGKKMMNHMVKITGEHALGCLELMMDKEMDQKEHENNFEDLLKKAIDNDSN